MRRKYTKCFVNVCSFTIELVLNDLSDVFTHNTLSSFTKFRPGQVNLDGQLEVAKTKNPYPSMYQIFTEDKVLHYNEKLTKRKGFYNLEPGVFFSITDLVETKSLLISNRDNHNKTCVRVKKSRITK